MQPYPFPPPKVLAPLPRLPAPPRTLIRDQGGRAPDLSHRCRAICLPVKSSPDTGGYSGGAGGLDDGRNPQAAAEQPDAVRLQPDLGGRAKGDCGGRSSPRRTDGADEEENWDSVLDRLCTQVETALFPDPWLNRVATITDVNTRMGFAAEGARLCRAAP